MLMRRPTGEKFRRINILIRSEQYSRIVSKNLNISGLIRDLLDDHFSECKITLAMGDKTLGLYRRIVSNFGAEDRELEPYFISALDKYLEDKGKKLAKLRREIHG